MAPNFTPRDVLDALRAGKARDFDANDFAYFAGAPAGSCALECFGPDWFVIVGAGFQVEAIGNEYSYRANADGGWDKE